MITRIHTCETAEHSPMQRKYIRTLEQQTCGRLSAHQIALDIIGQQERKITRLQKDAKAAKGKATK